MLTMLSAITVPEFDILQGSIADAPKDATPSRVTCQSKRKLFVKIELVTLVALSLDLRGICVL